MLGQEPQCRSCLVASQLILESSTRASVVGRQQVAFLEQGSRIAETGESGRTQVPPDVRYDWCKL